MKKTIFVALALSLTSLCHAADIKGGFGITLGQIYNDELGEQYKYGSPLRAIQPPIVSKYFESYAIAITPSSRRISGIVGANSCINKESCQESMMRLAKDLIEKYGEPTKEKEDAMEWKSGTKRINSAVIRGGFFSRKKVAYELILVYTDDSLAEQAKKEKIKLEKSAL